MNKLNFKNDKNNGMALISSCLQFSFTCLMLFPTFNVYSQEKELLITTEDAIPLSMSKDNGKTIYGLSADKVHELLHRSHINYQMQSMSWNRAIELARTQSNTCVFSTARTDDREAHFKWIGPIAKGDWVMVGTSDKLGKITQLEQVKASHIGVYMGDAMGEYLTKRGYHITTSYDDDITIKNLVVGRLDYWASDSNEAAAIIANTNLKYKLSILFTFASSDYYLACNPNVGDDVIAMLREKLTEIKADGTAAKIEAKY
jgi:polar amino acid transport system substrate-binding protein